MAFTDPHATCSEFGNKIEGGTGEMGELRETFVVMLRIGWKRCPYCGDFELYRSRIEPLTWLDQACVLFLLQVVRCYFCELRHYRPVFFPVAEYSHPIRAEKSAHANDEKFKHSA